ncbi:beta-lactamase family protein [Streptomonospora sp. S1-112]|uniref:Beta-lactamase family protein n=1 Tax=Streptomonospora mangrovi TaxID=2883123 RepID=A0A9X3NN60_9ACTN|nr:serine hydrolase domain-containing protein [Streptomonospora mangrovi]MDA0563600.1 beta-lactamase family protein [Streptomonospora mangrovi]
MRPLPLLLRAATAVAVVLAAPGAAAAAPPAAPDQEVADYLRQRMADTGVPGLAYAVIGPEGTEHTAALGRDGDGAPMETATPLLWGSVAKPITATLVMDLAEEGVLDLDEPVRSHLPDFELADGSGGGITLRHLLAQTSGLPEDTGITDRTAPPADAYTQAVADLDQVHPIDPPGARHHYSSANYLLLGAVVEAATGRTFTDVLNERVLGPLGMADAVTTPAQAAAVPPGNRYVFGQPTAFTDAPYDPAGPSYGYIGGPVTDLARFAALHLNGRAGDGAAPLERETLARMHTAQARLSPTYSYGLGWRVDERNADLGTTTVWHGGAVSGYQAMVVLLPERERGLVLVQNAHGYFQDGALLATGLGAARVLAGGEPAPAGNGLGYPALLAGLCAVIITVAVLSLRTAVRILTRRPVPARPARAAAETALWLAGCAVVGGAAVVGLPAAAGVDLGDLLLWTPDVGCLLLGIAAACAVLGAVRVAAAVAAARARIRP